MKNLLLVSMLLTRRIFPAVCVGIIGSFALAAYADFPVGKSLEIIVSKPPPPPSWKLGSTAPVLHVTTLSGRKVSWSNFTGKPIVLEFGSLTEPAFRYSAASVNWLARKWKGKVQFVIVYQRESHPASTASALPINQAAGFSIPQPSTQRQRVAAARLTRHKLHLQFPLLTVDTWHNITARAYGSLPNMTFLIDAHGHMIGAWPWMAPWQLNGAIPAVLAGKPIPPRFMSTGFSPNSAAPMEFDYLALPPAAPQTLADAIDHAQLTKKQLAGILPAVADYSAALLKARQQILQLRHSRRQFNGNFRRRVNNTLAHLRKSATELTTSLHRWLNDRQYRGILSALDRGKLRRVFAANAISR
jgi:peroxiredoxin